MDAPCFLLASTSPRRKALLEALGIPFTVVPNPWEEENPPQEKASRQVRRLAREKLDHFLQTHPENRLPVLTADTLLSFRGLALNKPSNAEEAWAMYRRLAGHTHTVLTSFAWGIPTEGRVMQRTVATRVDFVPWNTPLYRRYLETREWQDAAGGYKIQEGGWVLVRRIRGSWSNVVGLPSAEVYDMISQTLRVPGESRSARFAL